MHAKLLLSVGELNRNKNHETVIRALAKLNDRSIHYAIAGRGELRDYLRNLSEELGVADQVHLLGFRSDVRELMLCADIFMFMSKREGLGVAAIEAMACKLPLITSNVHGILDYSVNGETGFNCDPTDVDTISGYIRRLIDDRQLRERIGKTNQERANIFALSIVIEEMKALYRQLILHDITCD